jgi:hypothetical protein
VRRTTRRTESTRRDCWRLCASAFHSTPSRRCRRIAIEHASRQCTHHQWGLRRGHRARRTTKPKPSGEYAESRKEAYDAPSRCLDDFFPVQASGPLSLGYHVTGTFVYVSRFSSSESEALLERRRASPLGCRAWGSASPLLSALRQWRTAGAPSLRTRVREGAWIVGVARAN